MEYVYYQDIDLDTFRMFWLAKMFVLFVTVVFGIIAVKKLSGGVISIARTLFTGGLISFIRAITMVIAFSILYYPDGEFYQKAKDISFEQMEKKVEAGELERVDLAGAKGRIESQLSLSGYSVSTLFGSLITGLVVSVLMAAFVATNKMYEEE
jgi:hypothetical protein